MQESNGQSLVQSEWSFCLHNLSNGVPRATVTRGFLGKGILDLYYVMGEMG